MRKLICILTAFYLLPAVVWGQGASDNNPWGSMNTAFAKSESKINLEEDYYLGRAVTANIISMPNYRVYTANSALTAYLNRICQAIVINSPGSAVFNGYHVVILNSQEFNAFATPGGHIMLTKGLVEASSSEDALAALIAHELAHIMLRHAAEIIEGMSFTNEMGDMANKAAALSGNSAGAQKALALRNSTAPLVDAMIKNGYSQKQEFDADAKALELLNAAGYDPKALIDMLQVLQRVQTGQKGGFNSTHPTPKDRITNVNLNLSRYKANTTQSYRKARFINK